MHVVFVLWQFMSCVFYTSDGDGGCCAALSGGKNALIMQVVLVYGNQ